MFDSIKRSRTLVLLGVYLLTTAVLVLGSRGDGGLGTLGAGVAHIEGNAQVATHAGLAGIGNAWDRYLDLVAVGEENERLRAELDRVRSEHTRLLGVMQENARLRQMVGFAESRPELELVPARVIAKDVSSFFRVISIRLEVPASVQAGMPVVASSGLVGHVSEVNGRHADVMLTVDPRSSVDVFVQHNRARGVLRGSGHDRDYRASVSYLLRRDRVAPGDVVVTSGMGARYPADLIVGRVARIREQSYGMFQDVEIEPAVDFSRVEEVFVIVGTR